MLVLTAMDDKLSFYEQKPHHAPLSIFSVPTELGSDARGLDKAPEYLYTQGLKKMLKDIGVEVSDEIDFVCPQTSLDKHEDVKNLSVAAELSERIARAVDAAAKRGESALVLGGDHSVSIGSIKGAASAHRSLGVIWIDAHPDTNTDKTTLSGNIHGMPAALAMGEGHPDLLGSHRKPVLPANFLFIGLKDFDQAEVDFLRDHKPPLITMLDISRSGLLPVFTAIDALARRVDNIWISMDMDSINRAFAPGVAMQNSGGLTAREVLALAQYIGKVCNVVGMDVVEILPAHDIGGQTAALALEIISNLLGSEYNSYSEYMTRYAIASKTMAE